MLTRSRARLAIGVATALVPLAGATSADARWVNKCKGGYCISANANGLAVQQVQLSNDSGRDKKNVYATFYMLVAGTNGTKTARKFAERYYSTLPKTTSDFGQTVQVWRDYCNDFVNVTLPNAPVIYPCANWASGHVLGALIYENGGATPAAGFFNDGDTITIKA